MGRLLTQVLLVPCGGLLGTGARSPLDGWVAQRFGKSFPIGTLVVEIVDREEAVGEGRITLQDVRVVRYRHRGTEIDGGKR